MRSSRIKELISKDLLFRNKQLKRMQNEILDLEDFDDNITLADFSLDEFRIDLLQFLESSLFSGRDGKLPNADETPTELEYEYELLTWLVIIENPSKS